MVNLKRALGALPSTLPRRISLAAGAAALALMVSPTPTSAVVGGRDADVGEFPWTTAIEADGKQVCGATVISGHTLLTAAQCVDGRTASSLSIRYGTVDRETGGQVVKAAELIPHESYDAGSLDYDIAVIRTTADLVRGNGVQPVCLPAAEQKLTGAGRVSGWGATREGGESADRLQAADLPLMSDDEATAAYEGYREITGRMIGAGLPSGGRGPAERDEGSPLVVLDDNNNATLAGLYSWARGSARPGSPAIFTSAPALTGWIKQQIAADPAPTACGKSTR
ncbi:serine protease [Streptomyces sp. NPDC051218]|uniref:serine protease n=1 Tax=Streptomyces sp. NPDC051218 TaxID=3365645 RepID=UPI00379973BB